MFELTEESESALKFAKSDDTLWPGAIVHFKRELPNDNHPEKTYYFLFVLTGDECTLHGSEDLSKLTRMTWQQLSEIGLSRYELSEVRSAELRGQLRHRMDAQLNGHHVERA